MAKRLERSSLRERETGGLTDSVNYRRDKKAIPDETASSYDQVVSSRSILVVNGWIEEMGLSRHDPTQRCLLASRLTGVQAGANNHSTGSMCSRSICARSNGETKVALSTRNSLNC